MELVFFLASRQNRVSSRQWTEIHIADHVKERLHRIIMILRITMLKIHPYVRIGHADNFTLIVERNHIN